MCVFAHLCDGDRMMTTGRKFEQLRLGLIANERVQKGLVELYRVG